MQAIKSEEVGARSKVNTNEETRLPYLLLKKANGKHLELLPVLYLNTLSDKKAGESAPLEQKTSFSYDRQAASGISVPIEAGIA